MRRTVMPTESGRRRGRAPSGAGRGRIRHLVAGIIVGSLFATGAVTVTTGNALAATAGRWDQWFYAINLYSGKLEWKFHTFAQPAVTPYPGEVPRDVASDGGMITSSAWYQPGNGQRPNLVIFGGGYTLYALNAHTGKVYWYHRYTGRPTK